MATWRRGDAARRAAEQLSPPATERWLTRDGLQLCFDDRGTGATIVLAHGMWCDAGMFAALAEDLATDHRVLVPDFRAHGRSEVPATGWSIADLADDLHALLDDQGIARVTLAGFSMGGMAAVDFALRFPDRLEGLGLIGTSAASEELVRSAEIRALAKILLLAGPPRFLAHEAARTTFSAEFRASHPTVVGRWVAAVHAMSTPALVQALRAVGERPSHLEALDAIRVPTVIVTGAADRVVRPRWSAAMARRLAGSRLVTLPGVGHAVPTERPTEVAALLRGLRTPARNS